MDNIPTTDQWKLKGDCAKCRRANYCGKDCAACKKRKELIAEQTMKDLLAGFEKELKIYEADNF